MTDIPDNWTTGCPECNHPEARFELSTLGPAVSLLADCPHCHHEQQFLTDELA